MERLKQVLHSPLGRRKNGVSVPKVFGVSLDELKKTQPRVQPSITENSSGSYSSADVPYVVDRICRHIFANGIEEEGIFRVNGNSRVIDKLKESFEKHGDADLESVDDMFAIAGLLKLFLRELPEAVIPESMTSQFVQCQEASKHDKVEGISQLKVLIEDLPKRHYDLLKYIIRFLVDVAAKDSNKMSPMGLAIVFGPNLFRCSAGIEGLRDQGVTNEIVCKFLLEYTTLFGDLTEPGPFTIPHIHQNREKRKTAPLRPPPPKIADNIPAISLPMEFNEDLRPTTSLSQEFMERASPFTIADGDVHSSIASPVLSAVASELVTRTISEAVLEHIFSATEVRSIFDHWGECDDMNSRNSTPQSTTHYQHQRRSTPTIYGTSTAISNGEDSHTPEPQHNTMSLSAPQPSPRPRTTAVVLDENTLNPQPRPRTNRQTSRGLENSPEEYTTYPTDPPKPKPRTKSAPPRHTLLGDSMHYSIDMPVVAVQNHTSEGGKQNHSSTPTFQKPKGPAKKVTKKQKSYSSSTPNSQVNSHKVVTLNDENNNNDSKRTDFSVPKLDLNHLESDSSVKSSTPTHAAIIVRKAEETTPPPLSESLAGAATDLLDVNNGEALLSTTPHGHQMDGPTPEPKPQLRNAAEDEQKAAQIKTLNKKINSLKKKVKAFEESFEAEHGQKPSTQEKNSKLEIKKALVDLTKCRKELKIFGGVEEEEESGLKEQVADNSRVDSIEPPNASIDQAGSRPDSVVNIGTSSEPPTMSDTLELLLKRLKDKRQEANRADDINTLTRDQVQEEKLAVQKALLHFESIHGRPQTKTEKELMRPLYDRYRQIKKALVTAPVSKPQQQLDSTAPETAVAESDPSEMMVTQHPDLNTEQSMPNGDEEDRGESPGADPSKAAKETNLQELSVPELKAELDKANNTKKKLRKLLRDFEDEFQKENNRKVQREDRGSMEARYQEYKQIKAKIKLLEVLLSKQEP